MNKLRFLFALAMAAAAASCDKLPDDSLLDGMWQVRETTFRSTANGVPAERAYWCFRLKILQLSNAKENYFAHFTHQGDSLFIHDLSHFSKNATEKDNNEWIERSEANLLEPWGIHPADADPRGKKLKDAFRISRMSDSHIKLENDSTTIILLKY